MAPEQERSEAKSPDFLSTRQAAALLGVSLSMVQRMVESGELQAWKTSGGHRRIPASVIEQKLRSRGLASPVRRSSEAVRAGLGGAGQDAYRILVVEDDPALLKLYSARITAWKLPVTLEVATDGYEAILKAARQLPDLMIVDLMLPKFGGAEVIRKLRADSAFDRMNIIVITGMSLADVEKKFDLPKGITVLGKPVPFAQLLGFVQAGMAVRGLYA